MSSWRDRLRAIGSIGSRIYQLVAGVFRRRVAEPASEPAAEPIAEANDDAARLASLQAEKERLEEELRRKLALAAARRAELERKYELERMKHDKWVTPQGERPLKKKREPKPEKKPEVFVDADGHVHEEIDEAADDAAHPKAEPIPQLDGMLVPDHIIVDEHHEGGKVLFREAEFYGQFNFRDTILQQLERYYVYLRRMRKHDPDAYGFYRAVGAHLLPYCSTGTEAAFRNNDDHFKFSPEEIAELRTKLPSHFKAVRPAFGCVAFGTNPLTELRETIKKNNKYVWVPKFMYFTKYRLPPADWEQGARDGDVYRLTVWWDKPHFGDGKRKMKYGVPQQFGIWVSKDGERFKVLKVKKSHNRWEIPYEFKEWARDRGVSAQLYLGDIFIQAVSACEETDLSIVRVNVHKGSLTAVFGVDVRRLAYFFKDRDIQLTHKGEVARIFHMVAPHQRKDGSYVKMHFRGLREFDWAGYHVQLTVPGKHHMELPSWNLGFEDWDGTKERKPKDTVSEPQFGAMMADYIRTGDLHGSFKDELKHE